MMQRPIQQPQQQFPSVIITYPSTQKKIDQFIAESNPDVQIIRILKLNQQTNPYQYQIFVQTFEDVMMLCSLNHMKDHEMFARKFVQFRVEPTQPHQFLQLKHYIFTLYKFFHCDMKTRTLNLGYFWANITWIAQNENILIPEKIVNPYQILMECLQLVDILTNLW